MEVSGELMLGKFSSQKQQSGGSESSDISDDDGRRVTPGGSIAKYPESSTGLSDNDWNPYATESDTNQTPRSNNSDDQKRGGYLSRATFNIGAGDATKGTTSVFSSKNPPAEMGHSKSNKLGLSEQGADGNSKTLDILRYVMDNEKEMNRFGRLSAESGTDTVQRESSESRSVGTEFSEAGTLSGRPSSELDRVEMYSAETEQELNEGDDGSLSGRQSVESGNSQKSNHSGGSGRNTERSQISDRSTHSKSTVRSICSERSDRLDQLSDAAGGNIKDLIDFESAQRFQAVEDNVQHRKNDGLGASGESQQDSSDGIARTRLTARLESYGSPVRSDKSPERSPTIIRNAGGYVSVAERERLLSGSPDPVQIQTKSEDTDRAERRPHLAEDIGNGYRLTDPLLDYGNTKQRPDAGNRSPSEISMKRVSNIFEETKRQVKEAVALTRPEPSGSEQRFPLRERLTFSKLDDSFKQQDKGNRSDGRLEKSRESQNSEGARSLNSEEVARVLSRCYADDELQHPRRKPEAEFGDTPDLVSAFDKVDNVEVSSRVNTRMILDPTKSDKESERLSRRVQELLEKSDHISGHRNSRYSGTTEYVPNTIDYSRLQRDLQEIQDSLLDVPKPVANDSLYMQRSGQMEANGPRYTDRAQPDDNGKSLETTGTTVGGRESALSEYGRESGVSEFGRKLVWDHGADLQYDKGYDGQFIGKSLSTAATSLRTGEGNMMSGRPSSGATTDTENDLPEFREIRIDPHADMTRAEKIVDQVMSRKAEGDLKESVEDIIARYRNERRDLFERLQAPEQPVTRKSDDILREVTKPRQSAPILKDPNVALSSLTPSGDASQPINGKKQQGLAERVYKILRAEDTDESDAADEKGMAKKVYKILASDRPDDQVNGILAKTMAEENAALKELVTKPKEDSSLDDSGLNATTESYDLGDQDVKRQLEYSQFSSPEKRDRSELTALREVISAPYSALSNAKSLLSTQLQKMSQRNFDKSVELRTPYRQAINCYPVYGVERQPPEQSAVQNQPPPREAWMPARRSAQPLGTGNRDKDLAK